MALIYEHHIFRGDTSTVCGLAFWTTNLSLITMADSKFCHWCEMGSRMGFFKKSLLHGDSCFYKLWPPKRKFEEVEPQHERIVLKFRRVATFPEVWEVVTG